MVTFICCHGDFEQAWIEALCALGDREEELALEHAYDDDPGEWP